MSKSFTKLVEEDNNLLVVDALNLAFDLTRGLAK